MPSLWEMLDTYIHDQLHAEMGLDGIYNFFGVVHVLTDDLMTLEKAIMADEFPIVLIRAMDSEEAFGEHGMLPATGRLPITHQYPYRIVTMIKIDGKAECRAAAQEMRRRVLAFLAKRRAFGGLTADDGETVRQVTLEKTTLDLHGRMDTDDATFYGLTETYFTVHTKG